MPPVNVAETKLSHITCPHAQSRQKKQDRAVAQTSRAWAVACGNDASYLVFR
jgi:hypothetical protein